jgi:hypothetical protein
MKSRKWTWLFLLLVALLVTGCASVTMTSLDDDARAKAFNVKPDKSLIYLYRNETWSTQIVSVTLDGKVAGQIGPQTYYMWEVTPGAHEVASLVESISMLKLTTEPGRLYFIKIEAKMGWTAARSLLQQVDEETGRKAVSNCKRARCNF